MIKDVESFDMIEKKEIPPYFEMGQRIIRARQMLTEMSQSQMTAALGLREPTYGNYERGARKMPPHVLEKFKAITGCSADYIYLGTGQIVQDNDEFMQIMSKIDDPALKAEIKSLVLKRILDKK